MRASSDDLDFVKKEILFFMDKIFQFSFAYIGVIFVALASIKLEALKPVADYIDLPSPLVLALFVLIVNWVYLVLASSCQFAVQKRGYFILCRAESDIELVHWEDFLRVKIDRFSTLAWNVDNFFGVVFYVLVLVSSVGAFIGGWRHNDATDRILLILISCLYLIPTWALYQLYRLNNLCIEAIKRHQTHRKT